MCYDPSIYTKIIMRMSEPWRLTIQLSFTIIILERISESFVTRADPRIVIQSSLTSSLMCSVANWKSQRNLIIGFPLMIFCSYKIVMIYTCTYIYTALIKSNNKILIAVGKAFPRKHICFVLMHKLVFCLESSPNILFKSVFSEQTPLII